MICTTWFDLIDASCIYKFSVFFVGHRFSFFFFVLVWFFVSLCHYFPVVLLTSSTHRSGGFPMPLRFCLSRHSKSLLFHLSSIFLIMCSGHQYHFCFDMCFTISLNSHACFLYIAVIFSPWQTESKRQKK